MFCGDVSTHAINAVNVVDTAIPSDDGVGRGARSHTAASVNDLASSFPDEDVQSRIYEQLSG